MTPAVEVLQSAQVPHELLRYKTRGGSDLAVAVADELGVDRTRVFKTLITEDDDGNCYVAVVPAEATLNLKQFAAVIGCKKSRMADQKQAEKLTGYLRGAISPIGQKTALPVFVAQSALASDVMYVSAGKRGVELQLAPDDLVRVCEATVADFC